MKHIIFIQIIIVTTHFSKGTVAEIIREQDMIREPSNNAYLSQRRKLD